METCLLKEKERTKHTEAIEFWSYSYYIHTYFKSNNDVYIAGFICLASKA